MKWSEGGDGKAFEQAPAGTHEAICIGVIDLGTQAGEWQGKPLIRRQVIVQWELPTAKMADGKPFICSKFYTASLNEKATLRADLQSWRGREFTEQELMGFESKNILGKPCLLSIIHNEKGKAKVASVMACPKGMTLPPPANKPVYFSLERGEYDEATFQSIGNGLQDMIRKSPEWAELHQFGAEKKKPLSVHEMESDIPF